MVTKKESQNYSPFYSITLTGIEMNVVFFVRLFSVHFKLYAVCRPYYLSVQERYSTLFFMFNSELVLGIYCVQFVRFVVRIHITWGDY